MHSFHRPAIALQRLPKAHPRAPQNYPKGYNRFYKADLTRQAKPIKLRSCKKSQSGAKERQIVAQSKRGHPMHNNDVAQ